VIAHIREYHPLPNLERDSASTQKRPETPIRPNQTRPDESRMCASSRLSLRTDQVPPWPKPWSSTTEPFIHFSSNRVRLGSNGRRAWLLPLPCSTFQLYCARKFFWFKSSTAIGRQLFDFRHLCDHRPNGDRFEKRDADLLAGENPRPIDSNSVRRVAVCKFAATTTATTATTTAT
jgi:hypothetical protein